jgi:DHA1 family bicyclomycin/chloramphenicol resistance-like MFS transporter
MPLPRRRPIPSAPASARDHAGFTRRGLVAFLALQMSLTALGIDLLLPAFPGMRADLGLTAGSTEVSGVITAFFIGLALGQVLLGTVSDSVGRRPVLVVGIGLYVAGAVLSILAPTLPALLAARFVWGFGAAGGRVLAIAIVRDRFVGGAMARTYSLVMAFFVVVPVIAPTLGALVLRVVGWRELIGLNVAVAGVALWLVVRRYQETLAPSARRPLRFGLVLTAVRRIATDPRSGPPVLAQAILFGAFASYLGTAEVVIGDVFGRPSAFPLVFGAIALVAGLGSLVNGRLVERVGIPRMLTGGLTGLVVGATALVVLSLTSGGGPPMALWIAALMVVVFNHATLIPNLSTRAMEPMGDIAGIASAVVGSVLIGGGAVLGSFYDRAYDGTVTPLSLAFLGGGLAVAVLVAASARAAARRDATPSVTPPVTPGGPAAVVPTA